PLFQSMFAFNNTNTTGEHVLELPGLTLSAVKSTDESAHFDLSLSMADQDGHLAGAIEFASDLFDRTTVERWSGYFVNLLEALCGAGDLAGGFLSDTERRQLLYTFNESESAPATGFIHQFIEERAATNPDAIAL